MVQKISIGLTVLWIFFIISVIGKSLALAVPGKTWLAGTEENASFLPRDIYYDINDTTRIARKGLGRTESFEPLVMKKDDREVGLNLKASNNVVGGRERRLHCRFRGKCNIAEKYKVSSFAFAADYRDPQHHPPRHNSMNRKH